MDGPNSVSGPAASAPTTLHSGRIPAGESAGGSSSGGGEIVYSLSPLRCLRDWSRTHRRRGEAGQRQVRHGGEKAKLDDGAGRDTTAPAAASEKDFAYMTALGSLRLSVWDVVAARVEADQVRADVQVLAALRNELLNRPSTTAYLLGPSISFQHR
nr:unnamed protein product [Digitaria exilis]